MVKYPEVTLLIQGPVNTAERQTFSAFPFMGQYKQLFSEIILSTYTEQVDDSIIKYCENNGIKLVHRTENIGNLEKQYNISYHTLSTLNGLKSVTTKYCIKHRTDEGYTNIEKLVEKFLLDDTKWVSTATIFGESSYTRFHAGDHLFIGRTDKLLETFDRTRIQLETNSFVRNYNGEPAAEVTFTQNWIRTSGEEPDLNKHYDQMIKYFDLVNDKEFMPFTIRINSIKKTCLTPEELQATRNIPILNCNTIEDILRS